MPNPTSNPPTLELEVIAPQRSGNTCDGKADKLLSAITSKALEMFGELQDLGTYERCEILMVRHGWSGADVARALGITQQAVSLHWQRICEELDINQTPARARVLMARQCDVMYQRGARMGDESRGIPIALKALELKAKLLGLNLEAQTAGGDITPYKTPDEIADAVRAQVLAIHGRSNLIENKPAA